VTAGPPDRERDAPAAVRAIAVGRAMRAVWENERGGLTFEIGSGTDRVFVKWTPATSGIDLGSEAVRLRWAGRYATVPQVLDQGSDTDGSWLVTGALPGDNAVTARWQAQPGLAVAGIGRGLRRLHDALPVASCPFSWSAEDRLLDLHRREKTRAAAAGWDRDRLSLDRVDALRLVADVPPIDRPVVAHGDACAPNTLLADDGTCCGHVDLGALGVADRWADLAVATWSCEWNYGPGWQDALLDAYGVEADRRRIRYYRLLWDLGP
jgi:aminoglycoside phosphotransferase